MNRVIQAKHQARSMDEVRAEFESSYREILKLVQSMARSDCSNPATSHARGPHPLTSYLGPNAANRYRFAIRVIRRWQRKASS